MRETGRRTAAGAGVGVTSLRIYLLGVGGFSLNWLGKLGCLSTGFTGYFACNVGSAPHLAKELRNCSNFGALEEYNALCL